MKRFTLFAVALVAGIVALPLAAQDAGQSAGQSSDQASGDDMFNAPESVTKTTDQSQNAAPRDALLKETTPRITGTFTSQIQVQWNWGNIWNQAFDLINPSRTTINQQQTGVDLGFVARPDTDISVTGEIRSDYPFTQQFTIGSGLNAATYTVPDLTVWSLYSKFTWGDSLFLTFGKQPIKWGTGYFFSPADDVFAQTAVDVANPTADREGPLALKVQYPIPTTMDNLYFFAAMPPANDPVVAANMRPQDVAVAAKAEFLFGNTEVAAAGFYQDQVRPQAILMATTGTNNFNFFGEGVAAFASPSTDLYFQKSSTGVYSTTDRSGDTILSGTVGMMYSNSDWNFTFVAQYLYNGYGYASLTSSDLLSAALGGVGGTASYSSLANNFSGLGKIGQHYGAMYASWTSINNSKTDISVLALANFSDGSGYINPTVSVTTLTYVKISGGFSLSWGGAGTEFADPAGLISFFPTINGQTNPYYIPGYNPLTAQPTLAFTLGLSFGTVSF